MVLCTEGPVEQGIRRLVLTGNKDEVPHKFNIVNPLTEEKYELLVIDRGRSPFSNHANKPATIGVTALRLTVECVGFTTTLSKRVRVRTRTRVRFVGE